ncbi:Uncharacterised protein [Yersinia enterocolitica]|nr:Uncharacterised protein [Yersinia enterocolitica]
MQVGSLLLAPTILRCLAPSPCYHVTNCYGWGRDVNRALVVVTIIVFFVACYFAIREPISLLWIIPLSLLCLSGLEKIGVSISCVGVILVCVFSILWVNSVTPIFGEEYDAAKENKELIDRAKKYEQKKENERVLSVYNSQNTVKSQLKDSSSAKFSDDRIGKDRSVCGLVNAKNSLGAFAGNKRYVSIDGVAFIDDSSSSFNAKWAELCQ